MSKKYFYQEKEFPIDVPTFSTDLSQVLEDKIKQYSAGNKTEANRHILFAYQDALRILRKLEGIYLEKQSNSK